MKHYGHTIKYRNESMSQIPYCGVCNRDLTDDEIDEIHNEGK